MGAKISAERKNSSPVSEAPPPLTSPGVFPVHEFNTRSRIKTEIPVIRSDFIEVLFCLLSGTFIQRNDHIYILTHPIEKQKLIRCKLSISTVPPVQNKEIGIVAVG